MAEILANTVKAAGTATRAAMVTGPQAATAMVLEGKASLGPRLQVVPAIVIDHGSAIIAFDLA